MAGWIRINESLHMNHSCTKIISSFYVYFSTGIHHHIIQNWELFMQVLWCLLCFCLKPCFQMHLANHTFNGTAIEYFNKNIANFLCQQFNENMEVLLLSTCFSRVFSLLISTKSKGLKYDTTSKDQVMACWFFKVILDKGEFHRGTRHTESCVWHYLYRYTITWSLQCYISTVHAYHLPQRQ